MQECDGETAAIGQSFVAADTVIATTPTVSTGTIAFVFTTSLSFHITFVFTTQILAKLTKKQTFVSSQPGPAVAAASASLPAQRAAPESNTTSTPTTSTTSATAFPKTAVPRPPTPTTPEAIATGPAQTDVARPHIPTAATASATGPPETTVLQPPTPEAIATGPHVARTTRTTDASSTSAVSRTTRSRRSSRVAATAALAPRGSIPDNRLPITEVANPEPDASDWESEDSDPERFGPRMTTDSADEPELDSDVDAMTDDGEEQEVEHGEEQIQWHASKTWLKLQADGKLSDIEMKLGNAKWTAPAKRDSVKSLPTGGEQDIYFHVSPHRAAVDLFLDALPVDKFWVPLAKQSRDYAVSAQREGTAQRRLNLKWFTPDNYMRVFAAVIMRGLVKAKDDPEFFAGIQHGKFKRTGAEEVLGISLNKYQQLLRYMHMVDNKKQRGPNHEEYDKLFKVRPLIDLLQDAFRRWADPGKDNGVDEAGIKSRSRWLRTFNPSKPAKYFIEVLMACDSATRFCWNFFVTESALKTVLNRHRDVRGRGQQRAKYIRVAHYQHEYNQREREVQDKFGSGTAQMVYFARVLRQYDSPSTYRIFTDRRWDSMLGVYISMKEHKVSYTATVKASSRYHVIKHWTTKPNRTTPAAMVKSKKMNKRGKYRSATTVIEGVRINTVLWNDSSLIGGVSADLGAEDIPVVRRTGRHEPTVSCPRLMYVRSENFRAVDIHDQLRACKWCFVFCSKSKAWPTLNFGLVEICVVNIFVVKRVGKPRLDQNEYRWNLVLGIVDKADDLKERRERASAASASTTSVDGAERRVSRRQQSLPVVDLVEDDVEVVPRFEGADSHHHDTLCEYVSPEQAEKNLVIANENPTVRELNRQPRRRDSERKTTKVRNPLFTSASACLVCKYQHGRRRETFRYCRECSVDLFSNWPKTNRATGFAKQFHPRLCSKQCFEYFHTHNIRGLDYAVKRQRSKSTVNNTSTQHRNTPSVSRRRIDNSSSINTNTTPTTTNRTRRSTSQVETATNDKFNV